MCQLTTEKQIDCFSIHLKTSKHEQLVDSDDRGVDFHQELLTGPMRMPAVDRGVIQHPQNSSHAYYLWSIFPRLAHDGSRTSK